MSDLIRKDNAKFHHFRARCLKKLFVSVVSLAVVAATLLSCSPTTRYKTLSFFFDGVPNPADNKDSRALGLNTENGKPVRTVSFGPSSYHKPYKEMKCKDCHDVRLTGQRTTEKRGLVITPVAEGLCQKCHKTIPEDVRYVHAPAQVNGCLLCHHHHESQYPKLAVRPGNDLCWTCHYQRDLSDGKHHAVVKTTANDPDHLCVNCHNPHHGTRRFFLKDNSTNGPNEPQFELIQERGSKTSKEGS